MRFLSLNCQRGYQPNLKSFLQRTLAAKVYDFILLQEFAEAVPSFVRGVELYTILEIYDKQVKEVAQTCIIYKDTYQLLEKSYAPFTRMHRDPAVRCKHLTCGSLLARFRNGHESFLLGSVHLHSGIATKVRQLQVDSVKNQVTSLARSGDVVVFGGDCNFGLPGELGKAEQILSPQFSCVTKGIGPTLDGRYSENVPHLPNRVAALLGWIGIPTLLSTDHLFVDVQTADAYTLQSRVLPDRVSDHSPIELTLNGLES